MSSMMDAPELMQCIQTYDLSIETRERPKTRRAPSGLWRLLVHGISTYLTSLRRERHAPACHGSRPFETAMDRFAREYPSLAPYALAMI